MRSGRALAAGSPSSADLSFTLAEVGALTGNFDALLDAGGSASTTLYATNLPAGAQIYAAGVSFDPATQSFGQITDVVNLSL